MAAGIDPGVHVSIKSSTELIHTTLAFSAVAALLAALAESQALRARGAGGGEWGAGGGGDDAVAAQQRRLLAAAADGATMQVGGGGAVCCVLCAELVAG